MSSNNLFYAILFIIITAGCNRGDNNTNASEITIITEFAQTSNLTYRAIGPINGDTPWEKAKGKTKNGKTTWVLYSTQPVQVFSKFIELRVLSPGDRISIARDGKNFVFSGKGSEKLNMLEKIDRLKNTLTKPSRRAYDCKNFTDYMRWDKYVDAKLSLQMPVVEAMAGKVTPFEFGYIKTTIVNGIEIDRLNAFEALFSAYRKIPGNLAIDTLKMAWDSTQYKPWGKWFRSSSQYDGSVAHLNNFNSLEVMRRWDFNFEDDSLASKDLRTFAFYQNAKDSYKGTLRERLLIYILDEQVITEMGLSNPFAQRILNDYFSQPGYAEYKNRVKHLQLMAIASPE